MLQRAHSTCRPLAAHIWAKDKLGFYIEPQWCSERLFAVEKFAGNIWDPACGLGRIIEAADLERRLEILEKQQLLPAPDRPAPDAPPDLTGSSPAQ